MGCFRAHSNLSDREKLAVPGLTQEGGVCTPGTSHGEAGVIAEAADNSTFDCG